MHRITTARIQPTGSAVSGLQVATRTSAPVSGRHVAISGWPSRMPDPSARVRLRSRPGGLLLLMVALGPQADARVSPDAGPTPPPPFQAPYLPGADDDVLQQVPAESDPAVRSMITLRARLDAAPASLATAAELARAYIDFGRQIGDAHYAGYAEAVLAPWLANPRPPVVVLVIRATI